jgi:hypothetical protein
MEAMAHRNRWFTELKNGGSFHGELLNNQMVYAILIPIKKSVCFDSLIESNSSQKTSLKIEM